MSDILWHNEEWPLERLKAFDRNPRTISARQKKILRDAIERVGFHTPILAQPDGTIISGHQRVEVLRDLGETKVSVRIPERVLTEAEFRQVLLQSNINNGEFDWKMLSVDFEIAELKGWGMPDEWVRKIKPIFDDQKAEETPPLQDKVVSTSGDVWLLGGHRVMCGDSTKEIDVQKLMNGQKTEITLTSPPYNLGTNAVLRGYNGDAEDSAYIDKSDHKSQAEYLKFLSAFTSIAIKYSSFVFCNIQLLAGNKLAIPAWWMQFHDKLVDVMVWDKEHAAPLMAQRCLNSVWEFIFIFTDEKNPKRSIKTGETWRGTKDNIVRMNTSGTKDHLAKNHKATFPVAFARHFITNFSEKSVLDLFGGTGSTLIACEETNRTCFMMELSPAYVDLICRRYTQFAQKPVILEATGENFDAVMKSRS